MKEVPNSSGGAGEEQSELIVSEADVKKRLDAFVAGAMPPHVSRSRVKTMIKQGNVTVHGLRVFAPDYRLKLNDQINLQIPEPDQPLPMPQDIAIDVLFEDDHLIVLNKPAGMVVHPAPGNWSGTLVNALLHHCGASLVGIGGVRRPGIVHRLDKDTSGIMVVAKTDIAHSGLCAQFADHGKTGPLERAYLALVWGALARNTGTIDAPLGRSTKNRMKRAVVKIYGPDSRHAVTHYTVIRHLDGSGEGIANVCLVECRLETGRTHQIRVHMSHLGHPLLGDQDYGKHYQTKANVLAPKPKAALLKLKRQALHAKLLGFEHPVSGEHMRFEAPLPADLVAVLESFSQKSSFLI